MDIAGTKQRVQRMIKVAEASYQKITELLERMEKLQNDLETTSHQVDHIEHDLAQQQVLLEALAEQQGLDPEQLLEEADLPPEPPAEPETEPDDSGDSDIEATSRPSATNSGE
jgi:DNA anti-recombination protein RmuC